MFSAQLSQSRRAGVALVLVLIVIVLMAILVVGLLVRGGMEQTASSAYHATASANMLADTAVSVVEAQINEAVTSTGGRTGCVWCSQPGAVRVYDEARKLKKIYRLYSAPALTAASADEIATNDLPDAAAWKSAPALWTDLNEPAAAFALSDADGHSLDHAGQGYHVYPILDARDPTSDLSDPRNTHYLDEKTDEWDGNWGFAISADIKINPVGTTPAAPCLPVRWIYVLQNGNLATPAAGARGTDPVTVPGASASNPIVGRIAFWTDDETCKVNVNTAAGSRGMRPYSAEGTPRSLPLPAPWDIPRFKCFDERRLFAENQPVRGEYQRYPGHPATTDLFNIWNALGMVGKDYPATATTYADSASAQPTPSKEGSSLYTLLPRYADDNCSQGGVRNTTRGTAVSPTRNRSRFYPTLGEMLYGSDRNRTSLSRQQAESGKFFLTTHSRAPEETLYGTPRVAMWPVNADTAKRTAYDQLLAFCTTLGPDAAAPFYVQRANPSDPVADWDGVQRNPQLYRYLQTLTDTAAPGFGGTLSEKYGSERDQILTEIFDYIRAANLSDHSSSSALGSPSAAAFTGGTGQVVPLKVGPTRGLGRIVTLSEIGLQIICTADGGSALAYQPPVTVSGYKTKVSPVRGSAYDPLYVSNLPEKQFLRDTSNNVVGWDGGTANPFPANKTLAKTYSASDPGDASRLLPGQKRLQAMLLMEAACPMLGYDPLYYPNYQIAVSGLHGLAINGQNPFPDRTTTRNNGLWPDQNGDGVINGMPLGLGTVSNDGGLMGFRSLLTSAATYYSPVDHLNYQYNRVYNAWSGNPGGKGFYPYRFVSDPFTVQVGEGGTMKLEGGCTIRLQIPGNPAVTYQTFNVTFPSISNLPAPDLPRNGIGYKVDAASAYTSNAADWWGFDNRIAWTVYPSNAPVGANASYQPCIDPQTPKPYLGMGCVVRADNAPPTDWRYQSNYQTPIYVPKLGAAGASDVVRTLVAKDGDYRLTAGLDVVDASGQPGAAFVEGPGYDDGGKLADLFMEHGSSGGTAGADPGGKLVGNAVYAPWFVPKVPTTLDPEKQGSWDWDNGLPYEADGAYANKPDEGNADIASPDDPQGKASPYYWRPASANQTPSGNDLSGYFSPSRIVPSAVMFGSLPTGVLSGVTWRTLLFRPQEGHRPRYANLSGPPDHLWLDLFTMPVVEPYAISEPFSTAGKINMNYQIEPFTYITRNTGVRAVLASELIAQVPVSAAGVMDDKTCGYKGSPATTNPSSTTPHPQRLPISLDETAGTLQQFEKKFRQGELFRSPSEICDLYLVPRGYSLSSFKDAWYGDDFALVGDNVRERPYGDIYPRLTVRSNTFTVHYRAQALKSPGPVSSDPATAALWDERRGSIVGESRGSTTIERFLDPGRRDLPDYATSPLDHPLDEFYEWRTVGSSRFPP